MMKIISQGIISNEEKYRCVYHGYIGGQWLVNAGAQRGQSSKLTYFPAAVKGIRTPNKRFNIYNINATKASLLFDI